MGVDVFTDKVLLDIYAELSDVLVGALHEIQNEFADRYGWKDSFVINAGYAIKFADEVERRDCVLLERSSRYEEVYETSSTNV